MPLIQRYFGAVYDYARKLDLSKLESKKKIGSSHAFCEIIETPIELKSGKKMPDIVLCLKVFSEKCVDFCILITLAKISFFDPRVITFPKILLH